jgi:hypothetical protein
MPYARGVPVRCRAPSEKPHVSGRPAALYCVVKAVTFPLVTTVTIYTKDDKRREACREILRIMYRADLAVLQNERT